MLTDQNYKVVTKSTRSMDYNLIKIQLVKNRNNIIGMKRIEIRNKICLLCRIKKISNLIMSSFQHQVIISSRFCMNHWKAKIML